MRWKIVIAIALFFFNGCDLKYGFIEANFILAPESRLPRWFVMPQGYSRKDLTMTIILYSSPSGGNVKMTLYGPAPERKKLMEKIGTQRRYSLNGQKNYDVYPNYSIITVDGIEEVFEQRRRDDIFYITDMKTSVLFQVSYFRKEEKRGQATFKEHEVGLFSGA